MEIDKTKLKRIKRTVLDPLGQVYKYEDKYVRIIKKSKTRYLQKLFESGLVDELERKEYLWPCKVSHYTYNGQLILESDAIFPTQNANSWTFEMYKEVGKLIIDINKICYKYGYELLDAHQGNVMWKACVPKYIDIGSIINKRLNVGDWVARKEFIYSIYYILYIWANGYPNIAKALITVPIYKNNDELGEICKSLCGFHDEIIEQYENSFPHSEDEILENMDYLKNRIDELMFHNDLFWTNYQDGMWGKEPQLRFKKEIQFIKSHPEIDSMLELGSNQGYFAYHVCKETELKSVLATDFDHDAIEKMYKRFRNDPMVNERITPIVLDFASVGWPQLVNYSSDIVVANALTHHLIFTAHMPLNCIVEELAILTKKYLILEFMPRGMAGASRIPEWYSLDWFVSGLSESFNIIKIENIEFGRTQIYAEKK